MKTGTQKIKDQVDPEQPDNGREDSRTKSKRKKGNGDKKRRRRKNKSKTKKEKSKNLASVSLIAEGEDGTVYSAVRENGKLRSFRVKKSQLVKFCFLNRENLQIMVRFDLKVGEQAGDVSRIVTNEDGHQLLSGLKQMAERLNNTVMLYSDNQESSRRHIGESESVGTFSMILSFLSMGVIIISGYVTSIYLKKGVSSKKNL